MAKVIRTPGAGMAKLEALMKSMGDVQTKVGVTSATKYEDGTDVAYVAAIQEFGSPERSIPPRPTFRPVMIRERSNWIRTSEQGFKQVAQGKMALVDVMRLLGEVAAGDVRKEYSTIMSPPLTPTTLLLRKLKREGTQIGGKVVGEAHRAVNMVGPRPKKDKSADYSGVSTKPLVFDGILIGAITSETKEV
jgi:hypothetical protein